MLFQLIQQEIKSFANGRRSYATWRSNNMLNGLDLSQLNDEEDDEDEEDNNANGRSSDDDDDDDSSSNDEEDDEEKRRKIKKIEYEEVRTSI